MTIPNAQFSYNLLVLHVYEHRQTILQWPASVPGNISTHAQMISRDNQAIPLGDSQDSTLYSLKTKLQG